MSKIVKGIVKGAKNIVKGVKKVFKKVASSTIGKVLLAAAVIYTGGVLFGAWGSTGPLSGMFGAWGSSAAAGTAGAVAPSAATVASVAPTAAAPALATAATPAVATVAATAPEIAGVLGGAAAPTAGSGIAGYASTALEFMKANPLVTAMGFQGLSSALSPDQVDLMREQDALRRQRFESLSGVGDIDLGIAPGGSTLYSSSGTPWHERLRRTGG